MNNSIFNHVGIPSSAKSFGKMMEEESKRQQILEQKERQQCARENHRDEVTEEYNQKSLEIAEQAKLLSEKSIKFTKISLWIGGITLLVTTIGAIFTILSYYR